MEKRTGQRFSQALSELCWSCDSFGILFLIGVEFCCPSRRGKFVCPSGALTFQMGGAPILGAALGGALCVALLEIPKIDSDHMYMHEWRFFTLETFNVRWPGVVVQAGSKAPLLGGTQEVGGGGGGGTSGGRGGALPEWNGLDAGRVA
uniref:Uncharacterized protein n=1 Tax=Chromera velia CCMP2878 TaxID=1169474 RepID=A0A0G4FB30_9ALVE